MTAPFKGCEASANTDLDRLAAAIRRATEKASANDDQPHGIDVSPRPDPQVLNAVRAEVALRRRRARLAPAHADLFGEPAWDIMLDIFLANVRQEQVFMSSVALEANIPATTTLRWLDILEAKSLVIRTQDPFDRRRWSLALSPAGRAMIEACFAP